MAPMIAIKRSDSVEVNNKASSSSSGPGSQQLLVTVTAWPGSASPIAVGPLLVQRCTHVPATQPLPMYLRALHVGCCSDFLVERNRGTTETAGVLLRLAPSTRVQGRHIRRRGVEMRSGENTI